MPVVVEPDGEGRVNRAMVGAGRVGNVTELCPYDAAIAPWSASPR